MRELRPGWTWAKLASLIGGDGVFGDGDWVETKDQDPAGAVRLIQLADIGDGKFLDKSSRYLTFSKAEELGCTRLRLGDVLVARMPEPLGRATLFPGLSRDCVTVVDVCILRAGILGPDPGWLMHAINAPQSRAAIAALQSGSTRARISRSNLGTIELPVPPLAEQLRIVAEIDKQFSMLDAGAGSMQLACNRLRLCRRAVFEFFLHASRQAPHRVSTVKDVSTLIQYGTSVKCSSTPPGIPVLRMGNINSYGELSRDNMKYATDTGEIRKLLLAPGDLLFNRTNSAELVGKTAVYDGSPGPCSFASYLIRVRVNSECVPEFLALCLNSGMGRSWAASVASQQVGQANINGSKLAAFEFPLPSPEKQREIVAASVARFASLADLENRLVRTSSQAARLRQSILKAAFEGKLVPQDPNDEPASVLLDRIRASRSQSPARAVPRKRSREVHV